MDKAEFETSCKADGYQAVEEKSGQAGFTSNTHTHPFSARVLVTDGEFSISRNGATELYRAGGSFTMQAGCEHAESFGPEGASFLAARKLHP